MPKIEKILFPVDFSRSSVAAARYVEAVAGRFEAEILLLHVIAMGEHNLAEDLRSGRQTQLDQFMADEFRYFNTQRVCVTGEAAPEIVACAKRWDADLVMIPTHGLGTFRGLLIGSVTAKVLHDLDCPVWTSVHSETAPPLEQIHCRRVLCAVDLTDRSHSVLEWAAWLAGEYQAELGIVHATAEMPSDSYGWSLAEEFSQALSDRAKTRIDAFQAGPGTRVFVNAGAPARVVSQAARDFNADLIVMGRHSGTGIAGNLHRNAYAILRVSPCPVISI